MIVDQHGQPIDLKAIREPQTEDEQLAQTRQFMREWDNHPGRGLTPARLNAILQEAEQGNWLRQVELADDMEERETQIYAEISKRKGALLTLAWDIEPPEDASPAEKKVADQVREWLRAVPQWRETVLFELMDAVLKGFKAIELWWELDGRQLQPRFAPRPQRWFCLDEKRGAIHLRSNNPYGEPLRPWGWINHIHRSRNGYLARGSLARVLAWPFLYKNYSLRDLAEFLSIYGLPLRIGKFPAGASDAEKRKLLQAVVAIGHNAAGIMPQSMQLEFQAAAQGTDAPFLAMMNAMDAAISKAILGQTLTSSEGQHGTQALGQVHNEVRLDILKSDASRIDETITSQLIAPWVLLNIPGADPKRLPRYVTDVPEPEDLELYANALPKLAAAGMKIGLKDLHRRLRIPMADDGEPLLRGPAVTPPAETNTPAEPAPPRGTPKGTGVTPAPGKREAPPSKAALAGEVSPVPRDALDDLVAEAVGEWRPLLQPMVGPLLAELDRAIEAGETIDSFRARLPELVQRMDAAPLGEHMARAAFVARLAGEADLDVSGDEAATT